MASKLVNVVIGSTQSKYAAIILSITVGIPKGASTLVPKSIPRKSPLLENTLDPDDPPQAIE